MQKNLETNWLWFKQRFHLWWVNPPCWTSDLVQTEWIASWKDMEAEQKPKRKKLNEWGVYEDRGAKSSPHYRESLPIAGWTNHLIQTGWWFQICFFMFIPKIGGKIFTHFDEHIFRLGWFNHQLAWLWGFKFTFFFCSSRVFPARGGAQVLDESWPSWLPRVFLCILICFRMMKPKNDVPKQKKYILFPGGVQCFMSIDILMMSLCNI